MSAFNFHLESDIRIFPSFVVTNALRLSALNAAAQFGDWAWARALGCCLLILLRIGCSFDSFQLRTVPAIMELHLATIKQ